MHINIFKGVIVSYILTFVSFLIFALVLTFSNFSDALIPSITLVISILSILIGSAVCTKHANSQGFLWGGSVGLIYALILYIFSSLLLVGFTTPIQTIYLMLSGILFGSIGGIIGINFKH